MEKIVKLIERQCSGIKTIKSHNLFSKPKWKEEHTQADIYKKEPNKRPFPKQVLFQLP